MQTAGKSDHSPDIFLTPFKQQGWQISNSYWEAIKLYNKLYNPLFFFLAVSSIFQTIDSWHGWIKSDASEGDWSGIMIGRQITWGDYWNEQVYYWSLQL